MIKMSLSIVVAGMLLSGCVGTIADAGNATQSTAVAKASSDTNATSPSLQNQAIDKAVEIADEHTDGKASIAKELLK